MHIRRSRAARAGRHGKQPLRVRISAEQFRDARVFAGFTREQAAAFCGVSLRTIGHWETGKARPAFAAFKLLRVYRHGDLIDPAWEGFAIVRGRLVTPENHSLAPHDLTWLSLLVRRAGAFSELLRARDRRQAQAAAAAAPSRAAVPAQPEGPPGPADCQHDPCDWPPSECPFQACPRASAASLLYGLVSSSTSDPREADRPANPGPQGQGQDQLGGAASRLPPGGCAPDRGPVGWPESWGRWPQQVAGWVVGAGRSPAGMAHGCAALSPAVGPAPANDPNRVATLPADPLLLGPDGQSLPATSTGGDTQAVQEAAFR